MRILVIDDDGLACAMTAAVLEDLGHDCALAEDAGAARAMLAEEPAFDLLVSDLNMPLISGIELFRLLRADGNTVPFILLSGDDPEHARRQEPRLDACLAKDDTLEQSLALAIAELAPDRAGASNGA